jgi:hypothetical protein
MGIVLIVFIVFVGFVGFVGFGCATLSATLIDFGFGCATLSATLTGFGFGCAFACLGKNIRVSTHDESMCVIAKFLNSMHGRVKNRC